ncbi:hypothetical protein D3C75_1090740 [compost metagenome]
MKHSLAVRIACAVRDKLLPISQDVLDGALMPDATIGQAVLAHSTNSWKAGAAPRRWSRDHSLQGAFEISRGLVVAQRLVRAVDAPSLNRLAINQPPENCTVEIAFFQLRRVVRSSVRRLTPIHFGVHLRLPR